MNDIEICNLLSNNINTSHIQFLREAYFGKNKNILAIQDNVQKIMDEFKTNPSILSSSRGTQTDKVYIPAIESLICKEFGFRDAVVSLTYGMIGVNAFTYFSPFFKQISTSKVLRTKDGIKFISNNMDLTMVIGSVFFTSDQYTAAEITACILHEIGHNFFHNNNKFDVIMSQLLVAVPTLGLGIPIKDLCIQIHKTVNKFVVKSGLKYIADAMGNLNKLFTKVFMLINVLASPLSIPPIQDIPGKLLDIVNFIPGTRNEKFADNFATSYGYGPEIVSLSKKLAANDGYEMDDIPIIRTILDTKSLPIQVFSYLFDVHPNSYARAKDQVKYAKQQVSTVTDPKVKKELEKQIKEMEKALAIFNSSVMKSNIDKGKFVSALMTGITGAFDGASLHSSINKPSKGDWAQFRSTGSSI